jgi:hypothetical protein
MAAAARPFAVDVGFANLLTKRLDGSWMVKNPGDILFSVEAHGGMRLPEGVDRRSSDPPLGCEELRQILLGFRREFMDRRFGSIEFLMGKVVPNNFFIPGLGTVVQEDKSAVSNFGIRVPLLAEIILEFKTRYGMDWWTRLDELARLIMEQVQTLDEDAGLKYSIEPTSLGRLLPLDLGRVFYGIDKMDLDDLDAFRELCIRVLHPIPNEGEGLTKTLRLTRERLTFIYYGVFIIACNNGGLEPKCTLSANHDRLSARDAEVGDQKYKYPRYQEHQTLQEFNLIAFENREDVERRIGICNGFLDLDGTVIHGKEEGWHKYKRNLYGPIQILRRAIFKEQITHAELIVLVASLGNNKVLLIDSACNCIEDARDTPESPLDTPSGWLGVAPISHEKIRDSTDAQFDELVKDRDTCREANKVLIQATEAKDKADEAAWNAEMEFAHSRDPKTYVAEATGAKFLVMSFERDIDGIIRTLGRSPECLKKIAVEMKKVSKMADEAVTKAHEAEQKYQQAAAELQRQQAAAELQRQQDAVAEQQRQPAAAAPRPRSSAHDPLLRTVAKPTTRQSVFNRQQAAEKNHLIRHGATSRQRGPLPNTPRPSFGGNTNTPSRKQKRSRRQNPYRKTLKKKYTRKRQNRRNNHTRRQRR